MQNAAETTRHRLRRKLHAELGETLLAALEEPDVVELMVNEDGAVWCDRLGKGMETLPISFSAERAMTLVGTVAALLGTVATADVPIVEGELPFDGARFEAIVPPVSRQALLSIRKHASHVFSLAQYITQERISEDQVSFLREAIARQRNIIVAGATASGKTTFANALLREKVECGDPAQRIMILECWRSRETVEI
ncbi:MAG: Flp pilus assembly complex ATPase component [bacterium]|nr:Flp pilus assembly complex ATPase component [bacterium]